MSDYLKNPFLLLKDQEWSMILLAENRSTVINVFKEKYAALKTLAKRKRPQADALMTEEQKWLYEEFCFLLNESYKADFKRHLQALIKKGTTLCNTKILVENDNPDSDNEETTDVEAAEKEPRFCEWDVDDYLNISVKMADFEKPYAFLHMKDVYLAAIALRTATQTIQNFVVYSYQPHLRARQQLAKNGYMMSDKKAVNPKIVKDMFKDCTTTKQFQEKVQLVVFEVFDIKIDYGSEYNTAMELKKIAEELNKRSEIKKSRKNVHFQLTAEQEEKETKRSKTDADKASGK
jgi:hypothetical protein